MSETMIICWCRDDSAVRAAALKFNATYRVSGCRKSTLKSQLILYAAKVDTIVFTAHGSDSEMGEESDKFSDMTYKDIANIFNSSLPNWSGQVHFDICYGDQFGAKVNSLLNNANIQVTGSAGETDFEIEVVKT